MTNVVSIKVKVNDDTKSGYRSVRSTAASEGQAAGTAFGDNAERGAATGVRRLAQRATGGLRVVRARFGREGDESGRAFGRGIGQGSSVLRAALAPIMALGGAVASALGSVGPQAYILGAALLFAASAAQQLAGAVAVLPGVFAGAAAAGATLMVALSGVGAALSAMGSSSGSAGGAGKAVASMARQIRAAQRQVEDAHRGVERAERQLVDAHEQLEDAQRGYQRSLKQLERAERDIARARQQAIRDLEDLAEAQSDATLDVEGADLALKRAQENLARVNGDRRSSELDKAEALHDVKEAEDRLSDAQRDSTRATEDNNAAQQKGIEGSDAMVSAREAYADAQEGVADAARAVEDAQQGVADAEQGVADAHRAVADAVENLNDAYAQQREAAAGAAGGIDAYSKALAELSPNARAFVEMLRSLKPAWDDVKKSVQDRLFAGFADDVSALAKIYLPALKDGMGGVASAMNEMARNAASALMKPEAVDAVNKIFDNTALAISNAKDALGNFIQGFLNLSSVGSDYLPGIGKWLDDIAARFKEWTQDPDAIKTMIDNGVEAFKTLWNIGENVYNTIKNIATGLSGGEGGDGFLKSIEDMTGALSEFANDPAVQMVLMIVGGLINLLIQSMPIWGPVAAGVLIVVGAIKAWTIAQKLLNSALTANPIGLVITIIGLLVMAIIYAWQHSETFRNVVIACADAIVAAWNWLKDAFSAVVDWIIAGWDWLTDKISSAASWISNTVSGMWNGMKEGARAAVNGAIWILNGLINGVNKIIYGLNLVNPFSDIPNVPYVPYLARGGVASGLAVVGEKGRELVQLPTGSRVIPHGDTERALAGQEGGVGTPGGRGGALELRVSGGADTAVANLIMKLIRTGQIQIKAA